MSKLGSHVEFEMLVTCRNSFNVTAACSKMAPDLWVICL